MSIFLPALRIVADLSGSIPAGAISIRDNTRRGKYPPGQYPSSSPIPGINMPNIKFPGRKPKDKPDDLKVNVSAVEGTLRKLEEKDLLLENRKTQRAALPPDPEDAVPKQVRRSDARFADASWRSDFRAGRSGRSRNRIARSLWTRGFRGRARRRGAIHTRWHDPRAFVRGRFGQAAHDLDARVLDDAVPGRSGPCVGSAVAGIARAVGRRRHTRSAHLQRRKRRRHSARRPRNVDGLQQRSAELPGETIHHALHRPRIADALASRSTW